jgi:peptide/nickel transport system substrate-binding protein
MCIDRYAGLDALSKITFTGGVTGFNLAGSEWALRAAEELKQLPGFRPDIEAERAKAREMLKEAGYEGLSFRYNNRGVAHPYDHMGDIPDLAVEGVRPQSGNGDEPVGKVRRDPQEPRF